MITAIVIPADENIPIRQEQIETGDLGAYRRLVGGSLELLNLHMPEGSLYINDEGKLEGLPINGRATALLWVHNSTFRGHDVVVGNAFIVGPADANSDDLTAPDDLVQLLFNTQHYRVEFKVEDERNWIGLLRSFSDWYSAYHYVLDLAHLRPSVKDVRVIPDLTDEMHVLVGQWLEIGQRNSWIKNASDPPFTRDSFSVCYTVDELEERIGHTNWCLGQAFFYRNLCFINQVNGGDEWLTIRSFEEKGEVTSIAFESFTFAPIIERGEFAMVVRRLLAASKQQCQALKY